MSHLTRRQRGKRKDALRGCKAAPLLLVESLLRPSFNSDRAVRYQRETRFHLATHILTQTWASLTG